VQGLVALFGRVLRLLMIPKVMPRKCCRARVVAFVGGVLTACLGVTCPGAARYWPTPVWLPLGVWLALLVLVAWYDDRILNGWMGLWFICVLDLYFGVCLGWYQLRPPLKFDFHGFVEGILLGVIIATLLYVVVRWLIVTGLARMRQFIQCNECMQCGYPLIGLPSTRCPECGTPFDSSQLSDGGPTA